MNGYKALRRLQCLSPPPLGLHIVPWVSQLEETGWLVDTPAAKTMEGS